MQKIWSDAERGEEDRTKGTDLGIVVSLFYYMKRVHPVAPLSSNLDLAHNHHLSLLGSNLPLEGKVAVCYFLTA